MSYTFSAEFWKKNVFASVQHTCRLDKQDCADKVSSSDPLRICEIAAERK